MKVHNNLKQGTPEWLAFRFEKVSGTRFGRAISSKKDVRQGLIFDLIAEKYSTHKKENYASPEMARGTDEEKFAAEAYAERFDVELEVVDICQHDTYDWLMFSPDRFTNNRKKYLEIKCPDSATMVGYTIDGKIPSKYQGQVLLSFIVNEEQEEAELVIFDARFKEYKHQMTVIKVTREESKEAIEDAKKKLELFRKEWEEVDRVYQDLIF
jgi:hypothetical protein